MAIEIDLPPREGEGISDINTALALALQEIEAAAPVEVAASVADSSAGPDGDLYVAIQAGIALVDAQGDASVAVVEAAGAEQVSRVGATPGLHTYASKAAGDSAGLAVDQVFYVSLGVSEGFQSYTVTGSGTSTAGPIWPDLESINSATAGARLVTQQPNLFTGNDLDFVSADSRYINVDTNQVSIAADTVDDLPCWKITTGLATSASCVFEFPRASFGSDEKFSAAIRFLAVDAASGGSSSRSVYFRVSQRASDRTLIGTEQSVLVTDQSALTFEMTASVVGETFDPSCAYVRIIINLQNANGSVVRNCYFRDMICVGGVEIAFRRPVEYATNDEAEAGTDTLKLMNPANTAAAVAAGVAPLVTDITTNETSIAQIMEALVSPRSTVPDGLTIPDAYAPFIYKTPSAYKVLIDPTSYVDPAIWTVTPYYVDPVAGNDTTGTGLSWATAVKSLAKAIQLGNADGQTAIRVYGQPGYYTNNLTINGNSSVNPSKPCAVIGYGGRIRNSVSAAQTWAIDGTHTNTYSAARTAVSWVFDMSDLDWASDDDRESGDFTAMTNAASAAACNSTPGTWYADGTKVYVRRTDDSAVTNDNTLVTRTVNGCSLLSCTTDLYFENVDFEGGGDGACILSPSSGANRAVVFVDCSAKYAGPNGSGTFSDGFSVNRQRGLVLFYNRATFAGVASKNGLDGYSVHCNHNGITGITRSGATATATTQFAHGLATGQTVTVAGASQSDYNVTATVTVTGASTFTYTVANSPTTPATGTITFYSALPRLWVIRYNCIGRDNGGRGAGTSNNGFTTHEEIGAIDIESHDHDTIAGSDYHCINQSVTWKLGGSIVASDTDPTSAALKISNTAKAWVEGVTITGVGMAVFAQSSASEIYLRDCTITGTQVADSGCLIGSY